MHSFMQPLFFVFYAFMILSCFVSPALSAPIGARSVQSFNLPSAPAYRIFPYGKLSDKFLRVNDAYLVQDFMMPDDASNGRAPAARPQFQPHDPSSRPLHKLDVSISNPTSPSTRPFREYFVAWSAKAKAFSFTSYLAAFEKMQKEVASRARRESDI